MSSTKDADDIRRRDVQVFISELFSGSRFIVSILSLGATLAVLTRIFVSGGGAFTLELGFLIILVVHGTLAWNASRSKRFYNAHLKALWDGCQDRHQRFESVIEKGSKTPIADLREMPDTIHSVGMSVYRALRKADIVAHELSHTEQDLGPLPMPSKRNSRDPQSQELLQVAERNIAEYRQSLAAVYAGVQRTEAQAAVYMTTLDTLRIRMQGHRLAGRSPEMPSHEFLATLAETKLQLESIDKALDELDLGLYPQTIAAVRPNLPPIPPLAARFAEEQENEQHQQG